MNGFVYEMLRGGQSQKAAAQTMKCYNSTSLSVLSSLAMEYAVFDRFYASIPGPTEPNRMYLLSGTSHGADSNIVEKLVDGYPQRTIFDDLYESGVDFGIYYSDFPVCLMLKRIRDYPDHVMFYQDFFNAAAQGTLPSFSFIEPRWLDFWDWKENDQHPPHSTLYGEFLIKEIYEAVRSSPNWNETLFLITYDEHGGLYDHVPPPQDGVPNPDGIDAPDFKFDRLGIRVPFVAVSPWVEAGTVVHEPATSHFDHTSVLGTVRKIFNLKQGPLTKREAWSATFEDLFTLRTTPRDTPKTLPLSEEAQQLWTRYIAAQRTKETTENVEEMTLRSANHPAEVTPVNELQQSIIDTAWGLTGGNTNKENMTVHQAARYVREQLNEWKLSKKK
jgi:phospholipase C